MILTLQFFSFRNLSALITVAFSTLIFGQSEVNLAQYQEKYKNDLGVVLNHTQTVNIAVNAKTNELDVFETDYEEILYLKSSAKFYTDQSISLSEFFEDIVSINVVLINPAGKKFKLKKDGFKIVDSAPSSWVFHDDDKEIVFAFPKLGAGYRTIIEYTKKVKRPEFFEIFHFVSGYPVVKSKLEVNFSEDVDIRFFERNFKEGEVVKNESIGKKGIKSIIWEVKNIPAYKKEIGSTNINNHIPHVFAQIKSFKLNGEENKLVGSVDELHDFLTEFLLLKDEEKNRKELNDVVRSLIENKKSDYEKIDTIYKWVQTNIKYIAFEDGINGYVPRACSAVMKNRYGDCKDMGNLLVEMLNFAGVKNAYVAWVGTRDLPYQMSEIPSPLTCNHVICVVEKPEGGYYYLDATGSEMGLILPPSAIQEKELLIHLAKDKYELFKVKAVDAEHNYIRSCMKYTITENDSIKGTGFDAFGGYERESRSYDLKNLDDEDLTDYVKEICLLGKNRFVLYSYDINNLEDNNQELQIEYEFGVDNLLIEHKGDFIFNPILFKPRLTQYNEEDYKYHRIKDHHRTIDYQYEFEIPANYKIKHLPEGKSYHHEKFDFKTNYRVENNELIVTMVYHYRLLEIAPSLFNQWNEFSDNINAATAQSITLQKTN